MTDFYSQNRCVCSTRSHGPLLCAFCLSFYFKERHTAARDAYILWKTADTPRVGIIYDLMKQTKTQFKCALRQCKRQTRTIFADKANYRPICLSNVFSKLVENVLLVRILPYLETTCNQFGFKPKHGTEMCVFVLKELISYYVKHGSGMFVAYLDASNAFDRVNHATMFNKMLVRGVLKFIVKLLSHWYCNQQLFVRWGAVCSNVFFSK